MGIVILFGGGDAGGIRVTPHGIEPIPPWDPTLRLQLRALGQLVRAEGLRHDAETRLLTDTIVDLTNRVLTQIEQIVGDIDEQHGLIFQDDDGGFVCGSTGKPPQPFPYPVDPRRTVRGFLAQGVLSEATLSFLERASHGKLDVFTVAADPRAAAERIGADLTPEVERSLADLRGAPDQIDDDVDREVIDFYQQVVTDGRFITDWVVDPARVAAKLDIEVSREAIERVRTTRDLGLAGRPGGEVMSPAAVAVAVAIVIVLWTHEADLPVIDRSGISKL